VISQHKNNIKKYYEEKLQLMIPNQVLPFLINAQSKIDLARSRID